LDQTAPLDTKPHQVLPGVPFRLSDRDPAGTNGRDLGRKEAQRLLRKLRKRAAKYQEKLYAESRQSLLVVLQAMDTGGKDGTIKAVTRGINPQGIQVVSFKAPSKAELARDYLWRVHARVPPKGYIGIFNRSHYEDVLIVRVHGWADPEVIDRRYEQINRFEQLLTDTGTRVVKIMLHISKEYQLSRLRRRLSRPDKHWKFNPGDLKERALWPEYMSAYQAALSKCSSAIAPWYVVPAETRWYRDLLVSQILVNELEAMNPQYPKPSFDPSEFSPESIA
jgi:PPK2 family polyphosphate:nucleotide phosphotransferase